MRAVDDDLVRADPLHDVVHPDASVFDLSFDLERRKFVGDATDSPAALIRDRAVIAVRQNFVRAGGFVPLAEWAEFFGGGIRSGLKVGRSFGSIRRDDDPAAGNRILAKFGHVVALERVRGTSSEWRI